MQFLVWMREHQATEPRRETKHGKVPRVRNFSTELISSQGQFSGFYCNTYCIKLCIKK